MSTRWEVERAVLYSDLPAPARLIVLALLAKADAATAVIPPEHTPGLTTIAAMTGLGVSTVARRLRELDEGKWVTRTVPVRESRYERTRYAMHVPPGFTPAIPERDSSAIPERDIPERDCSQRDSSSPADTPGTASYPAAGYPGAGHAPTTTTHSPKSGNSSSRAKRGTRRDDPRPDVERLCEHLADRVEANGSRRPTITQAWRDAARRLIDKDGRTEEQITRAIDWCQDDDFWRANVLSMPKLREQYDRLRLAAQRGQRASPGNGLARRDGPPLSTADERFAQAMALAAKYAEEDG